MAHELIGWGRDAFEKGLSLSHIEKYLIKRGFKHHEALNALHEITAFEHKIQDEAKRVKRNFIFIIALLLLFATIFTLFHFANSLK